MTSLVAATLLQREAAEGGEGIFFFGATVNYFLHVSWFWDRNVPLKLCFELQSILQHLFLSLQDFTHQFTFEKDEKITPQTSVKTFISE